MSEDGQPHKVGQQAVEIFAGSLQTLMVAHGAALLALVTTYVKADTDLPPSINGFLLKAAFGLLLATIGSVVVVVARISVISPVRPADEKRLPRLLIAIVSLSGASLLMLIFSLVSLVELAL